MSELYLNSLMLFWPGTSDLDVLKIFSEEINPSFIWRKNVKAEKNLIESLEKLIEFDLDDDESGFIDINRDPQ
ncbi:5916_t:CDS:2 [Entrophospora sp. SA101]|nr:4437_t:CDS:2 [Entrophospora sp. SA101]CAJ0762954.1 5916_t:CDS:2 [Entrophospora sp. SA101]CAJ0881811.1 11368_t:CDS:2 [Entrophospora sp. SA101]CAJ0923786.1 19120_t:CDS:2 [Entrophospora sp. SA101]